MKNMTIKAHQLGFLGIALALAILLGSSSLVAPRIASAAPAGPTNLTATLVNNVRVDLRWADNSNNELGFRIESANDAAFSVNPCVFTVVANVTVYSDTTVYPGETFYYRVVAVDNTGASAPSNPVSVTTAPGSPAGSPTLPAPPAITPPAAGPLPQAAATPAAPATQATTPPARPRSTIKAPPTPPWPIPVQYIPTDLTLEAGMRSVSLTWKDNCPDETGYYIERSRDGIKWIQIGQTGKDAVSFPDKGTYGKTNLWATIKAFVFGGLRPNSVYYYRVRAFNDAGESDYSQVASITTKSDTEMAGKGQD